MKKCLAIILTLVLTLSLVACGGEPTETTPTAPPEVQLTAHNIKDYLAFEFDYSEVESKTKYDFTFGYTDITMKSYAVSSGSFNNVEITVKIYLPFGWYVSSNDKAYDENNTDELVYSFRLPASGEYTTTHDLIASTVWSKPNSNTVSYVITSVSGTFVPG